VHAFNYGDLPLWDHLFGTYQDSEDFVERCGFAAHAEQRFAEMLLFQDVSTKVTG
jgi:sterol desaturase/sphingolipid hydroxylase (fatty acid hydroxylase superfamily)